MLCYTYFEKIQIVFVFEAFETGWEAFAYLWPDCVCFITTPRNVVRSMCLPKHSALRESLGPSHSVVKGLSSIQLIKQSAFSSYTKLSGSNASACLKDGELTKTARSWTPSGTSEKHGSTQNRTQIPRIESEAWERRHREQCWQRALSEADQDGVVEHRHSWDAHRHLTSCRPRVTVVIWRDA